MYSAPCMTVPCESRTLPASSTLASGELTIKGWQTVGMDNATVNVINKQVWVYVTSVRTTGAITVSTLNKYYTAHQSKRLNSTVTAEMISSQTEHTIKTSYGDGGSGNDTLSGGSNADVLHGGADADYLYGKAVTTICTGTEGMTDSMVKRSGWSVWR